MTADNVLWLLDELYGHRHPTVADLAEHGIGQADIESAMSLVANDIAALPEPRPGLFEPEAWPVWVLLLLHDMRKLDVPGEGS